MTTSPSFTADANVALALTPRRTAQDLLALHPDSEIDQHLLASFHPKFTYPIFGDDEKIWGYKGLSININLASGSLHQHLDIKYASQTTSKQSPADDIEAKLKPYLAPDYTTDPATFDSHMQASSSFRPFGTLLHSYTRPSEIALKRAKLKKRKYRDPDEDEDESTGEAGRVEGDDVVQYEIWKTSWKDPGFKEYHRRMRFFIILFIEGGQYINEDEDDWEFAVLYEKRVRPPLTNALPSRPPSHTYHFAGYASLYPFLYYPDRVRLRLSQFFIIPGVQAQGHGRALYNALYESVCAREDIAELTVEDPSEAFEDLRDVCDLGVLAESVRRGEWEGKLAIPADGRADVDWLETKRRQLKIAPRQFARLYEMLLLYYLENAEGRAKRPPTDAEFRAYRLFVKERLYRFNYEQLQQIEPEDRKEKLELTYTSLMESYREMLDRAALDL